MTSALIHTKGAGVAGHAQLLLLLEKAPSRCAIDGESSKEREDDKGEETDLRICGRAGGGEGKESIGLLLKRPSSSAHSPS